MLAGRRERMDRAFEAVERVALARQHDLERLVVIVTADFASRHGGLLPWCDPCPARLVQAERIRAAASASTWQPSTMSSSRLSSAKSWLMPPIDGMNSIADGRHAETIPASWNAPLGMRCHFPGA